MLEPNELYVIADRMVEIYEKLNNWAVVDMADRIMEMQELGLDNLPGTVQGLAWVASQSGMHYQEMLKQIEDLTDISSEELHRLFEKSAVKSIINDNEMYKRFGKNFGISSWDNMSDSNKQIVEAMYERTDKQLRNFTRSTAKASQQQLHNALDTAYNEIIFGYKSYDKAIADAIEKVAKRGTVVIYDSGYQDSIETSIRRAVMTGINQTAGQISIKNALDIGAKYVKISSHSNARVSDNKIANHKGWQGKVYKLEGKTKKYGNLYEETGFDYEGKKSDPLGLCGYNCRHVINAYFPEYEELYEEDDEGAISQEEKEHEQQVQEREFAREERTLTRTDNALGAAIEQCEDSKLKSELNRRKKEIEYLLRSHKNSKNTTKLKILTNQVISEMPKKVQDAINAGTIIDVGKDGASQYDYVNDILYIAKGATKEEIIHEIGHMVENKLLDEDKINELKKQIINNIPLSAIITETYYDASGNPREIFIAQCNDFVSEYQGRLYISDISELFDDNMEMRTDVFREFISEPYREYIMNHDRLKEEYIEFYNLLKEAVEE